ncbi:MAG: septum formation protein [Gammaproteobacteria bacterium]|jgi:septum formation protein
MKINLASTSPRRQQLLKQIGIDFELVNIEIDETWDGKELAKTYVKRMALEKARAAKAKIQNNLPILAADTSVVLDNIILGKAETIQDAIKMLEELSGRTHHVYTAVALITDTEQICLNINHVSFRPLTETDILDYCETEEPLGKAGAYAIQGKAAAFIERLEGSYSGVMGLPLYEVAEMLKTLE